MPLFVGGDANESFILGDRSATASSRRNCVYAADAWHCLDRLHDAFDLCRDFFRHCDLESDDPAGRAGDLGRTARHCDYYHRHRPADGASGLCSRASAASAGRRRDAGPRPAAVGAAVRSVRPSGRRSSSTGSSPQEPGRVLPGLASTATAQQPRGATAAFVGQAGPRRGRGRPRRPAAGLVGAARAATGTLPRLQREFEPPTYLAERSRRSSAGTTGAASFSPDRAGGQELGLPGTRPLGDAPEAAGAGRPVAVRLSGPHGPKIPLTPAEVIAWLEVAARRRQRRAGRRRVVEAAAPLGDGCGPDAAEPGRRTGRGAGRMDELAAASEVPTCCAGQRTAPHCYLVLASRPDVRHAAAWRFDPLGSDLRRSREVNHRPGRARQPGGAQGYAKKRLAMMRAGRRQPAGGVDRRPDRPGGGPFLYVFHYCQALNSASITTCESCRSRLTTIPTSSPTSRAASGRSCSRSTTPACWR